MPFDVRVSAGIHCGWGLLCCQQWLTAFRTSVLGSIGMLWGTGAEPKGQVESLELVPTIIWPVELWKGQESQESVVCLLPVTQQSGTAAGLCTGQGRYTG